MELIQGGNKASKFAPEDVISNMPDNVVTHILDRLPLQEAVRTGILSRNWRFKWIMLSQLVFDWEFFNYLRTKGETNYGRIISRLLLHLKGVITKFELNTQDGILDDDINNWILFLSRNGIKDLTFYNHYAKQVPIHLFSCMELKHLNLNNGRLDLPASFRGFPNLLSLVLNDVQFDSSKFDEFLTRCPVLEILNVHLSNSTRSFKEVDARKRPLIICPYLKTLNLSNIDLSSHIMSSSAFEIMRSFPNLQTLEITTSNRACNPDGAIKRSPTTFPCLKTLKLDIDLGNGNMLSFAYEVIMSSPNLQTLEMTGGGWEYDEDEPPPICSFEVDYNTMGMLQLRCVVFRGSEASENEVCMMKYLLACSPFLEKFVIHASNLHSNEKLEFSTKLLKLHRVSPVAEICLY